MLIDVRTGLFSLGVWRVVRLAVLAVEGGKAVEGSKQRAKGWHSMVQHVFVG